MNELLESIRFLRESEDHIEFKEAKRNFDFNGGSHADPKKRRHCILGYVVALANEGGGRLVFGMADKYPHQIVGSDFEKGNLGNLEAAIYNSLRIRVHIAEEYDDDKRVIIFTVPSRPIGRWLAFEEVPLMRAGEELRAMSQDEMFSILSEQEPDFSAKICDGLTLFDLDAEAIEILKSKYAEKNDNPGFETLPAEQVLKDLELMVGDKLTYASLVLLGKQSSIKKFLPQNNVVIEYREDPASIQFDGREEFQQPLFKAIDSIWNYIKQPVLNPQSHIGSGPYIYDILRFNRETIRESILNAITHRSMQIKSDVVIKISHRELLIANAGGFPKGVGLENLLTVNSTPRSKLLADVLQKTGLVEKSGQGVDKMFYNSIMESKPLPDFSLTDNYQVAVRFGTEIQDVAFVLFVRAEQAKRPRDKKLNVFELLLLYSVRFGLSLTIRDRALIEEKLLQEGLLVKKRNGSLQLGKTYTEFSSIVKNTEVIDWIGALKLCFTRNQLISRQQYAKQLPASVSVDRMRYVLQRLVEMNKLERIGVGKGTKYRQIDSLDNVEL